MPYNSSAFEAQLAKYKNAKIVKDVADLPDDRHRSQTRIKTDSSRITPTYDAPKQGGESLKSLREAKSHIPDGMMLVPKKKRASGKLFTLLFLVGCLAVAGVKQRDQIQAMIAQVTATTGVASVPAADVPSLSSSISAMGVGGGSLSDAMAEAEAKAAAVASQGPALSMKYIQDETKRLQDMAKQIGAQSGAVPAAPVAAPTTPPAQPAQ